jgi:hypothetical protein
MKTVVSRLGARFGAAALPVPAWLTAFAGLLERQDADQRRLH